MKKFMLLVTMLFVAVAMSGCYEQIPAGYKGKVLGTKGFQPELYPPSKVWISNNLWNLTKERMYYVETTTQKFKEPLTVKLADDLDIKTSVTFRGRLRNNDKVINSMFNDIPMKNGDVVVEVKEAYSVYAQELVRNTARSILSEYNVKEVNKNYDRITKELYTVLEPKLQTLPVEISDITLGKIQFPEVVTTAIAAAKQRQMDIEKQKASTLVELTKYDGLEKIAEKEYNIKMMEAKRIADYNRKIADGITPDLLRLRELEVQQTLVENLAGNANTVYMPLPMMGETGNIRMVK